MCACQKGQLWSKGFLVETVETGNKSRNVSQSHALFCKDSLGKIDAKERGKNQSMNSIAWKHLLLGSKWILQWKLQLWGYKLIGCCKRLFYANESCDEHMVYFGHDWNDTSCSSHFWSLAMMKFLLTWFYTHILNYHQKWYKKEIFWRILDCQESPVSCRTNSLLISYLISKQARLNAFFKSVLVVFIWQLEILVTALPIRCQNL